MKSKITFVLFVLLLSCSSTKINQTAIKNTVNTVLDNWHKDVAKSDFEAYFNAMTEDAIFIGTDASENWTKSEFMTFAKPFFDKKKTWNFKPLERNIYFSKDGKTIWFDELLDTWMKICRGSGVLIKQGNSYKIKHYVLSFAIPNDVSNNVIKAKTKLDAIYIKTYFPFKK